MVRTNEPAKVPVSVKPTVSPTVTVAPAIAPTVVPPATHTVSDRNTTVAVPVVVKPVVQTAKKYRLALTGLPLLTAIHNNSAIEVMEEVS